MKSLKNYYEDTVKFDTLKKIVYRYFNSEEVTISDEKMLVQVQYDLICFISGQENKLREECLNAYGIDIFCDDDVRNKFLVEEVTE